MTERMNQLAVHAIKLQGVPIEQPRVADKLVRESNWLFKVALYAQAVAKYRQAIALWGHPAFYYNPAIPQVNRVHTIAAYNSLQRALGFGPEPLGADKYAQAQEYKRPLQEQLACIEIICHPPAADIALDGKLLFTGPGRGRAMVHPGQHQLVANKSRLIPETRTVTLSPGHSIRVPLAPHYLEKLATERRWPEWKPWSPSSVLPIFAPHATGIAAAGQF